MCWKISRLSPPFTSEGLWRLLGDVIVWVFAYSCWVSWRWLVAAVAILMPGAVLHAALPADPGVAGRTSLAGQLLIASPTLRAPFDHAVILMAKHDHGGALGIVINHPLERQPIANLLKAFGAEADGITESIPIFFGGPVSRDTAFVLHSADYHRPNTMDIDGRVALSGAGDVLRDIGHGNGPARSLVAFGYAGWGPSQLEDEITRGAWVTVLEDPALVFDDDRTKVWNDALALQKNNR